MINIDTASRHSSISAWQVKRPSRSKQPPTNGASPWLRGILHLREPVSVLINFDIHNPTLTNLFQPNSDNGTLLSSLLAHVVPSLLKDLRLWRITASRPWALTTCVGHPPSAPTGGSHPPTYRRIVVRRENSKGTRSKTSKGWRSCIKRPKWWRQPAEDRRL